MSQQIRFAEVEVGATLPERVFGVQRVNLVMYAGASGDVNVIHWNERIATAVGLPNVIAHGMFTMAQVGRLVTDWAGDPAAITDFSVRFSRPVVVPDDDHGAEIRVAGTVTEKLDGNRVVVSLTARVGESAVLSGARATVRLPA